MEKVDKILKQRITESFYWKQHCFGLNSATLCDKAAEIKAVGGLHLNSRPTPFICLVYKLVLIRPEREIVEELLHQPYFKYLTAIAAVYIRLMYPSVDVYKLLEPLLADYRKLRWQTRNEEVLRHMDELIDMLLEETSVMDLTFPRLIPRIQLEDRRLLDPPVEY
ncbi:Pre-mRNA-splicing factor 38 [Wickerhamiella sorbophila]|uniref:Pre-mRNA-splicing factor 38 n=1 Tax=Wickerhamiella sorbophila TaxID=45607 RepID=A0A2T0FKS7_9ASCO|nr:Pre-mRNA-splicing factor 38 [Wickerhamiella sorbophila]PRT55588.1 Pre-mRNA-splicing factor 38 [Wickerhamiella sorbophila]